MPRRAYFSVDLDASAKRSVRRPASYHKPVDPIALLDCYWEMKALPGPTRDLERWGDTEAEALIPCVVVSCRSGVRGKEALGVRKRGNLFYYCSRSVIPACSSENT